MIKFYSIPNFPLYLISKCGQIFSIKSNRIIRTYIGKNGYKECTLSNNRERKRTTVSWILRKAFFASPKGVKVDACLKDGNRSNATLNNIIVRQRQSIHVGKHIKLPLKRLQNKKVLSTPIVNILSPDNKTHMNNTLTAIRNTKGRFFGLTTKTETLNAQFRGETESFIKVWDRNENRLRRFKKNCLVNVNVK